METIRGVQKQWKNIPIPVTILTAMVLFGIYEVNISSAWTRVLQDESYDNSMTVIVGNSGSDWYNSVFTLSTYEIIDIVIDNTELYFTIVKNSNETILTGSDNFSFGYYNTILGSSNTINGSCSYNFIVNDSNSI